MNWYKLKIDNVQLKEENLDRVYKKICVYKSIKLRVTILQLVNNNFLGSCKKKKIDVDRRRLARILPCQ